MTDEIVINDYLTAVETLAANRSPLTFENSKPENAAIVISRIFKYANNEVKIYDDSLNGDIINKHPSLPAEIINFFRRDGQLKMVLRKENNNLIPLFELLNDQYSHLMQIRLANSQFRQNIRDVFENDIFFALNDKKALRMETTEKLTESRVAICSFHNPDPWKKLNNAFDRSFDDCRPYPLPEHA